MNKTIRLLKLIELLVPPGKTKQALANELGLESTRSVERYFKDLHDLGIYEEQDYAGRFFALHSIHKGIKLSLTPNEADFISDLMAHTHPTHPLTDSIQTKLFFRSNIGKWIPDEVKKNVSSVVKDLTHAMKLNTQIDILEYYSAYQGKRITRRVEPLFFTVNYRYLIAYEEKDDLFVNIKIDRIPKIRILEEKCTKPPDATTVDIFQMAFNEERHPISLLLTSLAYRILVEERPGADDLIAPYEDDIFQFKFSTSVATFLPISRFCMGLPGHVKVLESDSLKDFLTKRKEAFLW